MAELGPALAEPTAMAEPLAQAPKEAKVAKDLAYGPHARHVLDVYSPRSAANAPVVVFAHGGAFVDGNKDRNSEIYANVGWYFARNGVVLVNTEAYMQIVCEAGRHGVCF